MSGEQAEERTAREWLVANFGQMDVSRLTFVTPGVDGKKYLLHELLEAYAESECSRLASRVEELDAALRLLVEFVEENFEVPRDIPHLKKLVKHGRKALHGGK